jgi:hypothetical protein
MRKTCTSRNPDSAVRRLSAALGILICGAVTSTTSLGSQHVLDIGLSKESYRQNEIPAGWNLRKSSTASKRGVAQWSVNDGVHAVQLYSDAALTFLQKTVSIDIKEYPIVSWKWKIENTLQGVDERTQAGDDHPIRIFFVFDPDDSKQSWWFRFKRFLYLDSAYGHPFGGRFTEYVWSSHLEAGETINDPKEPSQKLLVVEGGDKNVGQWRSYKRNLYQDFLSLYDKEPRRLIFIGITNDTDHTGQKATSYIADLTFSKN